MKRLFLTKPPGARMPVSAEILSTALSLWQNRIAISNFSLGLEVTTDSAIKKLNAKYRGKNKATDVLSFPHFEFRSPEKIKDDAGVHFLGDIVISLDTCRRQAAEIGQSTGDEFLRLFTHGFLHLCGYDHELSPAAERKMFRKEDELLEILEQSTERKRKRKA